MKSRSGKQIHVFSPESRERREHSSLVESVYRRPRNYQEYVELGLQIESAGELAYDNPR